VNHYVSKGVDTNVALTYYTYMFGSLLYKYKSVFKLISNHLILSSKIKDAYHDEILLILRNTIGRKEGSIFGSNMIQSIMEKSDSSNFESKMN